MQYGSPVQDFVVFAIKTEHMHLSNQYTVLREATICLDKLPPIQTRATSCLTGGFLPPVLPRVLPPVRQEAASGLDHLPPVQTGGCLLSIRRQDGRENRRESRWWPHKNDTHP